MTFPELALSVRQPWAWAIIHAGKDIENRAWQPGSHALQRRGRVAVHAGRGLTREEYVYARDRIRDLGFTCPGAHELHRGGIIGSVEVVDVVERTDSPWFKGPIGLVLRNPEPCVFIPAVGQLGYFRWKPADSASVPEPASWMLPHGSRH